MNPYIATDDRHRVINFSGGRSSGFMLGQIVDAHGGSLPENYTVVFANTGKEREETLTFINQCAEHFGVEVVWLEYRYRPEAKGGRTDPWRPVARKGQPCRVLARSRRLNTVMLEFEDGFQVTTSAFAIRRRKPHA